MPRSASDDVGMTLGQRLRVWYRSDTWKGQPPKIIMEAAGAADRLDRSIALLNRMREHLHAQWKSEIDECLKY